MMAQSDLFEADSNDYGTIAIRVVVLPRKTDKKSKPNTDDVPLDLDPDEVFDVDSPSPVASYLEKPSGKLCCVFLVNGQRHDGLDNSFIVQQLGFKYLRKRMIVIVDVDGLRPEALGDLMQGSRQGFYKGSVWESISTRLIATLKEDPEIQQFEDEAEAEVARLEAGDQKVKEALDSLIEAHHHYADHATTGPGGGEFGAQATDATMGAGASAESELVSFLSPDKGLPSEYPVLTSRPDVTSLVLRPNEERVVTVAANPANAWPALADFTHSIDPAVPELHVAEDRSESDVTLRLRFQPPDDFDPDDYPVRSTLRIFARFNGFKEARILSIALTAKPAQPPPPPELFDVPSFLKVSARQPVRLWQGDADTHVRLRWNGKDDLVLGNKPWTFSAKCLGGNEKGLKLSFSEPRRGRLSMLVGLPSESSNGDQYRFEVVATGPNGETLGPIFCDAVVAERPAKEPSEPRLISGNIPIGASRRPPYVLKYITRESWDTGTCFGGENWTDADAGAFQEPTEKEPLALIINNDMEALLEFRKFLSTKKLVEATVESRLQKYTSHVAFHLYQMYEAARNPFKDEEGALRPAKPEEQRAEIRRVAMTLLRLMQVSN